jgi:SSS family solute:Na+ symporter
MLLIGLFLGKKARENEGKEGFFLAGRSLPLSVLVGTLIATWFGGGGVMGGGNFTYTYGPYAAVFFYCGSPLGAIALIWLGPKIRELAKYTVPEILEHTYGPKTRLLSSICVILAYTGIISYNFTGVAYIINLITGYDQQICTIVSGVVMVFLAVMAGMYSVAWTDALSAFMIAISMGIGLIFISSKAGGYAATFTALTPAQQSLSGGLNTLQLLSYALPTMFLYLGDQSQIQRYGAAKNPKQAKLSATILFAGMIYVNVLLISYCFFGIKMLPGIKGDTTIFRMAIEHVPFLLGAPILCSCVAFIVTTGDSFLLSTASNIVLDIGQKYIKPDMSEKETVKWTRIVIVLVGLLSYTLAVFFPEVLSMMMLSYSIYGASVTIPLLGAFLWKKASPAGGMASVLSGAISIFIWEIYLGRPMGVNSVIPGVICSTLGLVIFSLLIPAEKKSSMETASSEPA